MPPPISSAPLVPHAYTFPPSPGSHQHPAGIRYWLEKEWLQSKFHPEKFHPELCFMPQTHTTPAPSALPFLLHLLDSPLIHVPRRFLKSAGYFAPDAETSLRRGVKFTCERTLRPQYREARNRGLITKRAVKADSRAKSIEKFEGSGRGEATNETFTVAP